MSAHELWILGRINMPTWGFAGSDVAMAKNLQLLNVSMKRGNRESISITLTIEQIFCIEGLEVDVDSG
jgi:hypothetical protein